MKKRLLSAALALAMVLTMLPLTAFAANPPVEDDLAGDGTETVTYQATPDGNNYLTKGWYVTFQKKETDPSTNKEVTKTYYVKVTKGLAVNNRYYNMKNYGDITGETGADGKTVYKGIYNVNATTSVKTLKSTTIQVIGGTNLEIDAYGASSLNVDVYSGSVTIKDSGSKNTDGTTTAKLANITVTNTKKDYPTAAGSNDAPAVTLDTTSVATISADTDKRAMKVSLTGVTSASNISWAGANVARSVTLTNATIGEVTMNGVLDSDKTKQSGQTLTVNTKTSAQANIDPSVGDVDITGNGSKITIGDVNAQTAPTVALKGTSTSLTLNGTAKVGAVTLQGATADDVGGANKTTSYAPPSVTINKGTTADSIGLDTHTAAAEKSTGKYVVKVYGEVGGITLTGMAADVDVDGGTTDAITIGSGTIDVTGTYTEVGNVTVLKNATFTLATSAKNCTVGSLTVGTGGDSKTCEFKVPNEPSNTLGDATSKKAVDNYNKATIEGGTWVAKLPADVMKNLAYQLEVGAIDKTYTYYNEDQLGNALTAQNQESGVLSLVGETIDNTAITITFKNGKVTFGELKKMGAGTIKLPTEVNGTKVSKWSDGSFITDAGKDYSVDAKETAVTLDAQGNLAGSNITKLLNATVYGDDQKKNPLPITAAVNGTVITLSGAVTKGQHRYYLFFETDAVEDDGKGVEVPVVLKVELDYNANTGKLTFANTGSTDLGNGVMQEGFDTIVLSNGTRYTLNGTGLKVPSQDIKIPKLTNNGNDEIPDDYSYIEVDVRAPGYTTDSQKAAVAALLKGKDCSFDWSDSPAMNRAINAVQAGITEKQVEDWITAANRQAWVDNTKESYTKDKAAAVCYDQVWLVPFLKISVTDYKPNGSITMSLTPTYRIEVRKSSPGTSGNVNSYVVKANEGKFYSPNANGTALTLTSKDLTSDGGTTGGVTVKFALNTDTFKFVHQDNTYVYQNDQANGITITHAGTSGLGTLVINNTKAFVTLYDKEGTGRQSKGVFDTLQAAVDATEEGYYIVVAPGYKSTDTITVTGKPREFKIETSTILTVSNASGGLVDVDKDGGSKIYTIKLNREVVVNNSASIGVGTASNGTATVNMTRATAGSTVTITVNPSNGYRSLAPTVKTNSGAAVSVSGSGNTYTFVVPNGATSITVTPSFVQNTGLPFTDVAANAWYFDGVAYCYNNNLMQGYDGAATTFGINHAVTRAEVVTILWRLAGQPKETPRTTYTDVKSGEWHYDAIAWATNHGYAKGYGDGRFGPNNPVQRQELAVFLHRYAGSPTVSANLGAYSDGQGVADWALAAMRWATSYSILSGTNSVSLNGRLNAYSTAYREQVAVTLQRFHQYYK